MGVAPVTGDGAPHATRLTLNRIGESFLSENGLARRCRGWRLSGNYSFTFSQSMPAGTSLVALGRTRTRGATLGYAPVH